MNPLCICVIRLTEGLFPKELKLANVIPLYKSDDSFVFNNCRPVSLLYIISKVFEKDVCNRLLEFLETYKILILILDSEITFNLYGFNDSHGPIDNFSRGWRTCNGHTFRFFKGFWYCWSCNIVEKRNLSFNHFGVRGNALKWFEP